MKREAIDPDWIREAGKCAEIAKNGGILLYPSDTLWGLGCAADSQEGLQRIANLKNRPEEKSFITLVSSWRMLQTVVADIPAVAEELLEISNESITIIYPKATKNFEHLCAKDGTIAVRLVENTYPAFVMEKLRKPMVSTSANKSGESTPLHFEEISDEISEAVDYISDPMVDYKLIGSPSKVISIRMNGTIKVLR